MRSSWRGVENEILGLFAIRACKRGCRNGGEPTAIEAKRGLAAVQELRVPTLKSWSCARRVVAKAEWLPGMRGHNARFVVTNLSEELYDARLCTKTCTARVATWRTGSKSSTRVCGSDLYVQDAEQPVAALLLYYRQCNYDDHQGDCAQGHRDGNGAVRNHPCEAAEGRRGPARQHTTVPPIVFLGLSVAVVIRPCTGEFAPERAPLLSAPRRGPPAREAYPMPA